MQTYISRIAWALILLVLGTSCGGEPRLWVRLTEWPAGAETLHVVPWINGVPQKQNEITVPNGTPGFVITLPDRNRRRDTAPDHRAGRRALQGRHR